MNDKGTQRVSTHREGFYETLGNLVVPERGGVWQGMGDERGPFFTVIGQTQEACVGINLDLLWGDAPAGVINNHIRKHTTEDCRQEVPSFHPL